MLVEHALHIHTVIDLLFAGWMVWLLHKNEALEARIAKMGG